MILELHEKEIEELKLSETKYQRIYRMMVFI
jgi:hypothetical protein